MQNLCFGPEYTVSGCQSCAASILLHWSQINVWECCRAFRYPSTCNKMQNLCLVTECTISGYLSCWSIHSTPLEPNWCLGVFQRISLTFDRWQDAKPVYRAWMHYFGVPMLWNISIGPKMMFVSVSEHFANLQHVTICKTCVPSLNTLFRGIEVAKHPF
jgi:hypothetical protein